MLAASPDQKQIIVYGMLGKVTSYMLKYKRETIACMSCFPWSHPAVKSAALLLLSPTSTSHAARNDCQHSLHRL